MGGEPPFIFLLFIFKMFDWKWLLQKEITLPIEIGDDIKFFKYKQYTIEETLEFEYSEQDKEKWLFEFLNNHAETEDDKLSKKIFNQLPFKQLYKRVVWWLCKGFYDFDRKGEVDNGDSYPVGAYVTFICNELSIEPLNLIQDYTFEQLNYLTEWIVWNKNEQTEEWHKRNKKKRTQQEIDNMDKEEVNNILDWLRNKHQRDTQKDLSNKGT